MEKLSRVGGIINGVPWAIEPRALDIIGEIYGRHVAGEPIPSVAPVKPDQPAAQGGVAVYSIHGPVLPRASLMSNISGATSSSEIISAMEQLAEDASIKAVVIDIDSPGGSVLGGFEAADAIRGLASVKPTVASVSGMACSLAYLFASQCDEIYATRASVIGSIGVIARVQNTDRMERNAGVDTITVATSKHKAMSGLTEDETRDALKAEVAKYMALFVDAVDTARSDRMKIDDVANGKTWLADEAESLGLIDGISNLPEVIAAMAKISG